MNTGTFEIKNFTDKEILDMPEKEQKKWVKLTYDQEKALSGLNRKERRDYFRKHRDEFKGLSWSDIALTRKSS